MIHQDLWNSTSAPNAIRPSKSAPCSPVKPIARTRSDSFHISHKVPLGDTPYVKAKRVQLVNKDPERAIALFWAAINAGDRVDSALKDMAIVMKQQNRAEEAIEAIKSLRSRCSDQAQESLDNILLDLYKRCGRLDDQITLLQHKLLLIQKGLAFNGKRTKTARSQGRKFQVSVDQEATRLLGNLGWALMQKENYVEAEKAYRSALVIGPDNNKQCNLGICLMKQGKIGEAKETLKMVRPAMTDALRGADSHLKAYERAQEMLRDLESKLSGSFGQERSADQNWLFNAFLGSSSLWQPQPCVEYSMHQGREEDRFGDENQDVNREVGGGGGKGYSLNIDALPFYSTRVMKEVNGIHHHHQSHDPMGNLKRTRSGDVAEKNVNRGRAARIEEEEEEGDSKWPELPDDKAFDEAILAAVLGPVLDDESSEVSKDQSPALAEGKVGKRLRVFQDISLAMNSPKARIAF